MDYGDDRNDLILSQLEDVHGFATALPGVQPHANEISLSSAFGVSADRVFSDHAHDLRDFLGRMGVTCDGGTGSLVLRQGGGSGTFEVDAADGSITLTAPNVAMMWRAVAWIERHMAYRHAAILPKGLHRITPRFQRRITTSMLSHGLEDPADPLAYRDGLLRAMAHMGYSSMFVYVNLWPFVHSNIVPELTSPQANEKRQQLASLARRAARFGLDLVVLIAAPRLDANHPAFAAHPELKGAIVMRTEGHALCTSEPLAHDFYAEQMAGICRDAPGLGAMAYLIGGEGFLHCYTRPVPRTDRVTNCPRCGERSPAEVLLPLLNRITAAVKDTSPQTRVMFWPYASHIWTPAVDPMCDWEQDKAIVTGLDRRASWLCEIELHEPFHVEGIGDLTVSDYAIHFIGPSRKMRMMEPEVRRAGLELVVKTECNVDASFHSVPYIPVMQRWAARHRAIGKSGAAVTWETWRLNGFWASPSIEAAFWLDVEPQLTDEQMLRRIASRIYGPAAADRVIEAWSLFSDAWEHVYRNYGTYWWGPLVIGPAHLFDRGEAIFFPWTYGPGFFEVQAGQRETETPEVLADPRRRTPRFATMAMSYVPERLRDLGRAANLTRSAVQTMELALKDVPAPLLANARADVDMAAICWIILEADVAYHQFVRRRDEAKQLSAIDPRREVLALETADIVQGDLDRARLSCELIRRTPMIGWGYTFGMRFNESMIREKIERTSSLLKTLREGQW